MVTVDKRLGEGSEKDFRPERRDQNVFDGEEWDEWSGVNMKGKELYLD